MKNIYELDRFGNVPGVGVAWGPAPLQLKCDKKSIVSSFSVSFGIFAYNSN